MSADRLAQARQAADGTNPVVRRMAPGSVLLIDGDALAYFCAGREGVPPSEARGKLSVFILDSIASARCGHACVLLTGAGSDKGRRYMIASVKPYQGQRSNSRRPENWAYLRDLLTGGDYLKSLGVLSRVYLDREADDAFGAAGKAESRVIMTQDKDMRMLPGYHMNWTTREVVFVPEGAYSVTDSEGKQYGTRWFWLQMIQGDAADNVPGLPKIKGKTGWKPAGEVAAASILAGVDDFEAASACVASAYADFYKAHPDLGDWTDRFCEQAALLWMRRDMAADVLNFVEYLPQPLRDALGEAPQRLKERAWRDPLTDLPEPS